MNSTGNPTYRDLNDCGCCEGQAIQTPMEVSNKPALNAIVYRVGRHGQFKASMLARLSKVPGLTTRDDRDFSIALLDAWATVADVLTFYQERIANESYLRTATERRSLLELGRLIGYELRPGVAASTYLAFVADEAPGTPEAGTQSTVIEAGTKVQSVPGPGEQPQTFETVERIEARAEWNAIRPRLTQEQTLSTTMESITVRGTVTNVKPGESLLIVSGAGTTDREVKRIIGIMIDTKAETTRLDLVSDPPAPPPLRMPKFVAAVFFSAPHALTGEVVSKKVLTASWKQADLFALASVQKWSLPALATNIFRQISHRTIPPEIGVFAFRQHAAIFGHNAPKYASLPADQRGYPDDWDTPLRTLADEHASAHIDLDRLYPSIVQRSWIVLKSPTGDRNFYQVYDNAELSRSDFTLSAKVSRIELDNRDGFETFTLRETTVLAQSERLDLADLPIVDPVEGTSVVLDRVYFGLTVGQKVIVNGTRVDLEGVMDSEVMTLADVTFTGGFTALIFQQALAHSYVRDTVTICANVALATHGETVHEVLGSSNAGQPFQRFTLRQPPLTYISASTPSGGESTLQVWVNEVLWHAVPMLYGQGRRDHVFVTRADDAGRTNVQFGDGQAGARPPTGIENIRAVYRKGMGQDGLVKAGQLSLLTTRPLGVKSVTNPLPATGAADRESDDDARRNAPLTVLTLDRIVSLQDYEDFSSAFSGIAKALATWTWNGQARVVFITIAGPNGAEVPVDGSVYTNLLSAIQKASDPYIPVRVQSYRKAFFRVGAKLKVREDYRTEKVLATAEQSLRSHFAFDSRGFGQAVALSEVLAVMQGVPGVVAVDIDTLYRSDGFGGDGLQQLLPSAAPGPGADDIVLPAELLTLDPRPLDAFGAML